MEGGWAKKGGEARDAVSQKDPLNPSFSAIKAESVVESSTCDNSFLSPPEQKTQYLHSESHRIHD